MTQGEIDCVMKAVATLDNDRRQCDENLTECKRVFPFSIGGVGICEAAFASCNTTADLNFIVNREVCRPGQFLPLDFETPLPN